MTTHFAHANRPKRTRTNRHSLFAVTLAWAILLAGCKTTPEDIAFKTTGTIVVTADGAMRGWLDFKNTHEVPTNQVLAVREAWNKYYEAVQAEQRAVVAFKMNTDTNSISRAIALSSAAAAEVLNVILQFLPPANAAALKGVK